MSSGIGGRPTKYRDEYPQLAAVLQAQGYTEAKIAEVLRVGASTLSDWKRIYPAFAQALDADQCEPDATRDVAVEEATDGGSRPSKVEESRRPSPEFPMGSERFRERVDLRRRFDDYDSGQAALDRRERAARPTRARGM